MCPVGAGSLIKTPWLCLLVQVSREREGEHRSKATKACVAGLWRDAGENRGWVSMQQGSHPALLGDFSGTRISLRE